MEAVSLKDLKVSSRKDERIGVTHNSIFFSTAPNSPAQYSSLSGLCGAFNGGFMLSLIIHSKIGSTPCK